ncbi:MAG: hypothetical protein ACI9FB_002395 [Candidatus Azotimanducaceae bacterium]
MVHYSSDDSFANIMGTTSKLVLSSRGLYRIKLQEAGAWSMSEVYSEELTKEVYNSFKVGYSSA